MDLRAKLDRIRSMEPPAALFQPPPLTAAERDLQLRAALACSPIAQDAVFTSDASPGERPDLRRKLARLRSQNPPAASRPGASANAADDLADHAARPKAALQLGAPANADEHSVDRSLQPIAAAVAQDATPMVSEPLSSAESARKSRLRAALRALQQAQLEPAAFLEVVVTPSQGASQDQPLTAAEPQALVAQAAAPMIERVERAGLGLGRSENEHAPAKTERIAQLRALIADVAARDRLRAPLPAAAPQPQGPPPWQQEATEHGPLHVCKRYLEPDHHHGHAAVRAALYERPGTIPSLVCDPDYAGLDLSRALYLDTETTGLAGGTGTVAFLVGLARFDDESLCVEQLIVPQLGSETPVLARLAERLASASCLITYNGKSFDWPLLRTRFVLARLPVPPVPPHIDLLHVCRRVWKQRLTSVRLVDMEREVLRFAREDDLPGSEIPARYFEFLRGGSPDRLCPVLEHNQNDLIALAALLGAVMDQYTGERELCSPTDALHYGKLALRARDLERARNFGHDALTHSLCQREARAALTLCAEVEHKLGRIPEAIACLERALDHARELPDEVDALARAALHFTLAKLYEHEQHDLVRALHHARNTELVEGPLLHGRRLGRLHRRLLRCSADAAV